MPQISVITAVYNGEKFLRGTIESILNQTFADFEYIIINDNSKDNSLKIIKEYAKKDRRIKVINNKRNIGSASSRNKGLKIASGRYIAILDHDDISLPKRLELEYEFLEDNPEIFLVGGGAIKIDENGDKIGGLINFVTDSAEISEILPKKCVFHHPSIMYRNDLGLFYRDNILYADDYDFYLRLLSEGRKMANLKELLIYYRRHDRASSVKNSIFMELFAQKAREFYFQRLKYGKDEYRKFDKIEILNIDFEKSKDKYLLGLCVKSNFRLNNFNKVQKYSRIYFKNYGILNKFLLYFFMSFTNKKFVNVLRKIYFH